MSNNNNCIICKQDQKELWAKKDKYIAVKCLNCGLIWIDPLPTVEELNQFYTQYYQYRVNEIKLGEQRKIMYQLDKNWLEQFIKKGKLLDIGCSDGSFLSYFNNDWEKYGVEIGSDAVKQANDRGINVIEGSAKEALNFGKKFDCVMLRGTIEHFTDPLEAIEIASKLINPGGYLFFTATPDVDSFSAQLYKEKWNQFVPPAHLFYFSINTLTKLVEKFNFEKVAEHHFYRETPYANLKKDHETVLNDIKLINNGNREEVNNSPAFWGNMMTVLYQKKVNQNNEVDFKASKKKIIALIAARGGSKRVPRKNVKELDGKPLISYVIETALKSQVFDKVIVSTEDPEIAEVSKKSGAYVPFTRPKELATDHSLMGPVIKHALKWLEDNEKYQPEIVVILQAPTPFVKPEQIKKVVENLINSKSDVVYTVNEVDYPPYWMQKLIKENDGDRPELIIKNFDLRNKQGSDFPKTYRPNGAVYAAKTNVLLKWDDNVPLNLPFEGINTAVEIIDNISAIDIDNYFDFMFAEFVIKNSFQFEYKKQ